MSEFRSRRLGHHDLAARRRKTNRQALCSLSTSHSGRELLAGVRIRPDSATFPRSLVETLSLARRYRLSSYDASYLELALRLGLPLATLDSDLLKAARNAGVQRFARA